MYDRFKTLLWAASTVLLSLTAVTVSAATAEKATFTVIKREPHDQTRFTQGLEIYNNHFYESSGQYGESYLVKYSKEETTQPIKMDFPRQVFAEGLTIFKNEIYVLSWRSQKGWIFDTDSLAMKTSFSYRGEGWGLTNNGEQLILSDGSDKLRFYAPGSMQLHQTLSVTLNGKKLNNLNELEFHQGLILANRWHDDRIYLINPTTGEALQFIDISDLRTEATDGNREAVANGIAWDEDEQGFWVTGKYWRSRFLIRWNLPSTPMN